MLVKGDLVKIKGMKHSGGTSITHDGGWEYKGIWYSEALTGRWFRVKEAGDDFLVLTIGLEDFYFDKEHHLYLELEEKYDSITLAIGDPAASLSEHTGSTVREPTSEDLDNSIATQRVTCKSSPESLERPSMGSYKYTMSEAMDEAAKMLDNLDLEPKTAEAPTVCPIAARVTEKMLERAAVGLNKYGVTADRNDLSVQQWLQHAQEEAMDLAIYLEKIKKELTGAS